MEVDKVKITIEIDFFEGPEDKMLELLDEATAKLLEMRWRIVEDCGISTVFVTSDVRESR